MSGPEHMSASTRRPRRRPTVSERRSFLSYSAAMALTPPGALAGAAAALTHEKPIQQIHPTPRTLSELKTILHREFPRMCMCTHHHSPSQHPAHSAQDVQNTRGKVSNNITEILLRLPMRARTLNKSIGEEPAGMMQGVRDGSEFAGEFRQKTCDSQVEELEVEKSDTASASTQSNRRRLPGCHNYGNEKCDMLSSYGIQMYHLGVWPEKENERNYHWHELAVAKLNDNAYLVLDKNGGATFWHGTLAAFVENYHHLGSGRVPMALMPKGIAPYKKLQWNTGIGKALAHFQDGFVDEERMQSVNLHIPRKKSPALGNTFTKK